MKIIGTLPTFGKYQVAYHDKLKDILYTYKGTHADQNLTKLLNDNHISRNEFDYRFSKNIIMGGFCDSDGNLFQDTSNLKHINLKRESKEIYTLDKVKKIAKKLNIKFIKFNINQFKYGMNVESEHGKKNKKTNVTNDDPITTAKITLAHLNEFPDYYIRLKKMEKDANKFWKNKLDESVEFDDFLEKMDLINRNRLKQIMQNDYIKIPGNWNKLKKQNNVCFKAYNNIEQYYDCHINIIKLKNWFNNNKNKVNLIMNENKIKKLSNLIKEMIYFTNKVIAKYKFIGNLSVEVYAEDENDFDGDNGSKLITKIKKNNILSIVGFDESTGITYFKINNKIYGNYFDSDDVTWVSGKKINFNV